MRQAKLVCEFLLASHFRRGPPMMSKTVLDLLHSLGVEDDMIMFDNFGGICEQIRVFSHKGGVRTLVVTHAHTCACSMLVFTPG